MGQPITISGRTVDGTVTAFHTDRGITGQDGAAFTSPDAVDESFPGRLAARLFESDGSIDHVFVASNQVVVRRPDGWDDATIAAAQTIVESFFVFYADA